MVENPEVRTLMDTGPYSVSEDETLLMAWEVLERSGQRALPVVRGDGCCAGVLNRAELAVACTGAALSGGRVRDLVHSRRTARIHPEESLSHAAAVMTEEDTDALPVTDSHGRLVGLLTARDYVAAAAGLQHRAGAVAEGPARVTLPGLPPEPGAREHGITIP
ncbi:CBS domain-containing protein [Streptomyces sp. NPDC005728]|uniref:CBS domain-containing protein n=1 Tax=Streptomyces sp. NPDC005728 TaxID=3157054 RepID=UPI0033CC7619